MVRYDEFTHRRHAMTRIFFALMTHGTGNVTENLWTFTITKCIINIITSNSILFYLVIWSSWILSTLKNITLNKLHKLVELCWTKRSFKTHDSWPIYLASFRIIGHWSLLFFLRHWNSIWNAPLPLPGRIWFAIGQFTHQSHRPDFPGGGTPTIVGVMEPPKCRVKFHPRGPYLFIRPFKRAITPFIIQNPLKQVERDSCRSSCLFYYLLVINKHLI